jgi:hypothetical protein
LFLQNFAKISPCSRVLREPQYELTVTASFFELTDAL